MKRTEITDILARRYKAKHPDKPLSRAVLAEVVDIFIEIIRECLVDYGEFGINNMFSLAVKQSKRTRGYDIVRQQEIEITPKKSLKVKTSRALRDLLNGEQTETANNSTR